MDTDLREHVRLLTPFHLRAQERKKGEMYGWDQFSLLPFLSPARKRKGGGNEAGRMGKGRQRRPLSSSPRVKGTRKNRRDHKGGRLIFHPSTLPRK